MGTNNSPKLSGLLSDSKGIIKKSLLFCICITVFFTSVNAQSVLTAVNDKASTGPLQKVKVNVLANDAVSCSNYALQILSSLDPETQGTATVLPNGYIEFIPGTICRNTTVDIPYKVTCGINEAEAILSVDVGMYNYPVNVIDEDVSCYDIMLSNIPFGIREKFKTENGAPSSGYCIDGMSSPMVGDLNGDGKPEIVMMGVTNSFAGGAQVTYRYVNIYNGQTGARMYRYDLGDNFSMGDEYHRAPSSLALADLDNDGIGEIVVATRNGTVCAYKPVLDGANITGMNLMWTGNVNETTVSYAAPLTANRENFGYPHPYIADLNGDGIPEVIIYNKIFNGQTGALLMSWRNNASSSAPKYSSILSNQNGLEQLFLGPDPISSTNAAIIKNAAMTGRRIGANVNNSYNDGFLAVPVIVDIDGDGQQEIITGNRIHKFQFNSLTDHTQNTYYTIEGPVSVILPVTTDGTTKTFHLSDGFTRVADIDGDGKLDIVVVTFANDGSLDVNILVYVWDLQNPTTVKAANTFYSNGEHGNFAIPFIGDINGKYDGWNGTAFMRKLPEICILGGAMYINRVTSNNGRSGVLFHELSDTKLRQGTNSNSNSDTDAGWDNNQTSNSNRRFNRSRSTNSGAFNGHIIGLTYNSKATKIEERLQIAWAMEHSDRSDNTGITLFDFDNNNTADICYRDETTLRVISPAKGNNGTGSDYITYDETESTAGTSVMFTTPVFSGTGFEYPTIADINMDGSADILVTQNANSSSVSAAAGYIRVFEYSGQKWAPCPPVWNQSMYDPTQIREDLKVNAYPQSMLTAYFKNGETIYPFNGSWIQQPIIKKNNDYVPVVRHPDAMVRNVEVKVKSSTVTEVTLTLFNKGTATIASSSPISFYNGWTSGEDFANSSFIGMQEVGTDIFPNETNVLTFTLSGNFSGCLLWTRIMANNTEFPASGYEDCDLTNNTMEGIDCPYLNVKTMVFPSNVICGTNGVAKLSVTGMSGETFIYAQTPTFQWYKNDIAVQNATDSVLIVSESGTYNCLVTDGICRKKTQDETVTIDSGSNIDQLVINGLPESGYLCQPPGQVEITVGNPESYTNLPISYQWYKDGVYQPDRTVDIYITSLPGTYRLLLSSGSCMTSESFVVTQTDHKVPDIPPVPSLTSICSGNTLSLTAPPVTSNGCEIKSQGWQVSTTSGGSTFVDFDPSTPLSGTEHGKNLRYYATNDCGTTYSNVLSISVMSVPVIEMVSSPPAMCANTGFSVPVPSVTDGGGSALVTSSWQIETSAGSGDYTDIGLAYTTQSTDNGKKIRYRATNGCGDGYSNAVEITVNPLPVPVITGSGSAAKGQAGVVYETESGMSEYVWTVTGGTITSGGDGYDEAIVTWGNGSIGIITVTYKSNGCAANTPTTLNVNLTEQETPSITGGYFIVCPVSGNSYTYQTDANKFNYKWEVAGGTIIGSDNTDIVSITWDETTIPAGVKVSFRHQDDSGLPLVESIASITKQAITKITKAPAGGTVCYGNSVPVNIEATGEDILNYQWKQDGTNVGTNSANYTVNQTGSYTVTVSGICGTVTSTPVTVTVKDQPVATLGGTTMAVATQQTTYTAGTGSNYNWNVGDAAIIAGGTSADNYATVSWAAAGQKSVTVNYVVDGCPTTAATAAVLVTQQGAPKTDFAPELIANGVCHSITGTYTTESGHFKYKWTVTGGTIDGVDNTDEVTVIWGSAGTGTIKVAYSEDPMAEVVESDLITFTIHGNPTVAAISAPAGVCDNKPLNLSAPTVNSTKTVSDQGWILNGIFNSGDPVTYTLNGTNLLYQATNICGTTQSNTVQITVYELPSVTATPQNICQGYPIDLAAAVANPGNYTLAFYTQPAGGTVLSSSTVSPAVTTTYYVETTNSNNCTSAVRKPVTINVEYETVITQQPVPIPVVGIGNIFSLSVTATGNNLAYQWYKNGAPISGNTTAITSILTVTSTTAADYGAYYVVVAGSCGPAQTSNSVVVDILSPDATLKDLLVNGISIPEFDPQVTEYTYDVTCDMETVGISGIPNHPDATVVINLPNRQIEIGDNWYAIVVTAENRFTTKTYMVNVVRDCYVPKILKNLEDAIICIGESHTFEIIAEGDNLTYEWYYGNNRIIGANSNTYTVNVSELKDYERYYVIVRSNFNGYKASAYSKNVRLWVADYLSEKLLFSDYPNPATTGKTYHIKLAGYPDVTKYSWSYHAGSTLAVDRGDNDGVIFSPVEGGIGENETWATFGTLSEGRGTVTVTLEHPCGTREVTQDILVKYPTGMEDITASPVQVYPNPTSGIVKVSNTQANQTIRVTDTKGSLKGIYPAREGTTTIDLTGYAKGTYILEYNSKIFKLIKK